MLSCMKPSAVALSVLIEVGGCGWPKMLSKVRMGIATCALWKTPPVSASAADDTTCRSVLHSTRMALLRVGCLEMVGFEERWK